MPGSLRDAAAGLASIGNIADIVLRAFRVHYTDNTFTKDAIFDYVYGILNDPNGWFEDLLPVDEPQELVEVDALRLVSRGSLIKLSGRTVDRST